MSRAEKVVWLFFAATCFQLTFLHPSTPLVPGERTNLFSGLLCFITLVAALIWGKRNSLRLKSPEVIVSLALGVMAAISGALSLTPLPSSFRVFVLLASGLGGFWCARILLRTPESQRLFLGLCLFLLGGLVLVSLTGYALSGNIEYLLCGRNHPIANLIFLLSFAPLTLLTRKSRPLILVGVVLLCLSYATLCLSQRISVIFIPLALCCVGALFRALNWKHLLLIAVLMAGAVGFFHQHIIWQKFSLKYPYYRIENFPFSWSIAKEHPLVGIGLRTPRVKFLENYEIRYPLVTKEEFARDIANIVTPDNIFLAFLVGLGIPFTLTYFIVITVLLVKLVRLAFRPPPGLYFHPLVLLFPLAVALVHYQLYDGLLFPQNCWFFHILLGLIPVGAGVRGEPAS